MSHRIFALFVLCAALAAAQAPERVYRSDLVSFPGPWSYQIRASGIVLTTDEELETLASDPDKVLNLSTGRAPRNESLREICEKAQKSGQQTLKIAFDHFFRQYRPGQDTPRRLMPDMDEYIRKIAAVGHFAEKYGLGLELSLLTPLEMGSAYMKSTGESGGWMQYRKGVRDPKSGAFSVQLWRQREWANNKGPLVVTPARVRAFAFRETPVAGTFYHVVDPASIVEIKDGVQVEVFDNLIVKAGDYRAERVRIHGRGALPQEGLNRVLVVQEYHTPEMDYFSPKALPFLKALIDKYAAAGVKLNGLYSDEMHIQGDWAYGNHHDNGEFTVRYMTDSMARRYAQLYGEEYRDFAKYLIYFTYGQEDTSNDVTARENIQHVFGSSPEAISRTALFRNRYYHLLQDSVTDLFVEAKHYAEQKMGHRLDARYHATWAESPTVDFWQPGGRRDQNAKYEYTSSFLWSNTVHQAATACYDYFKWGDFLVGNGNDFAEGGWLDRNYLGLVMAVSTGILNQVPYAYEGHWGMPAEINQRRSALASVYGAGRDGALGIVEGMQHRDVNVMMLYPIDLVAVEERFGSWMTQYGYANLITAAKLLEMGKVQNGAVEIAGRRFNTLVATFEPFPSKRLLSMMQELAAQGGHVIWSGPPPLLTAEGDTALGTWQSIFGVNYTPEQGDGLGTPGMQVVFEGALAKVQPQTILTDMLPDHIYPVTPNQGTATVARVKKWVVGAHRTLPGGGSITYLGFRPRDDQSRSMGYDVRTWFDVLTAVGAYPATGRFNGTNDNTEYISRTGHYLTTRFPNGAVAIAPHLRSIEENWAGGFARNLEADRKAMAVNPPPSDKVHLAGFKVDGHTVTYEGRGAMSFRVSQGGELVAFAGSNTREITLDGKRTQFAGSPVEQIAWAPITAERRVANGAVMQIMVSGGGPVRIPASNLGGSAALVAEGAKPGSRGEKVPLEYKNGTLSFTVTPELSGKWLYVTQ